MIAGALRFVVQKVRNRRIAWRVWAERRRAEQMFRLQPLPEVSLAELLPHSPVVLPPLTDDICLPPFVAAQPAKHDDYTPLMTIASSLRPKVIVELGTAHGNTVANLCRHCPAATVYTVNAPASQMTGAATTFALAEEEIGRVYRGHGFGARVVQIYANTLDLDLGRYLNGAKAELAIVDACHDTSFVLNDFRKVLPHIAPGGMVLLHDTHPSMHEHLIGSYVACMMLRAAGFDVKYLRGTWWGVWTNGNESDGRRGAGARCPAGGELHDA